MKKEWMADFILNLMDTRRSYIRIKTKTRMAKYRGKLDTEVRTAKHKFMKDKFAEVESEYWVIPNYQHFVMLWTLRKYQKNIHEV